MCFLCILFALESDTWMMFKGCGAVGHFLCTFIGGRVTNAFIHYWQHFPVQEEKGVKKEFP